jgi:hypothetical protein
MRLRRRFDLKKLEFQFWWARNVAPHTATSRYAPHEWARTDELDRHGNARKWICDYPGCEAFAWVYPIDTGSPLMHRNEKIAGDPR